MKQHSGDFYDGYRAAFRDIADWLRSVAAHRGKAGFAETRDADVLNAAADTLGGMPSEFRPDDDESTH